MRTPKMDIPPGYEDDDPVSPEVVLRPAKLPRSAPGGRLSRKANATTPVLKRTIDLFDEDAMLPRRSPARRRRKILVDDEKEETQLLPALPAPESPHAPEPIHDTDPVRPVPPAESADDDTASPSIIRIPKRKKSAKATKQRKQKLSQGTAGMAEDPIVADFVSPTGLRAGSLMPLGNPLSPIEVRLVNQKSSTGSRLPDDAPLSVPMAQAQLSADLQQGSDADWQFSDSVPPHSSFAALSPGRLWDDSEDPSELFNSIHSERRISPASRPRFEEHGETIASSDLGIASQRVLGSSQIEIEPPQAHLSSAIISPLAQGPSGYRGSFVQEHYDLEDQIRSDVGDEILDVSQVLAAENAPQTAASSPQKLEDDIDEVASDVDVDLAHQSHLGPEGAPLPVQQGAESLDPEPFLQSAELLPPDNGFNVPEDVSMADDEPTEAPVLDLDVPEPLDAFPTTEDDPVTEHRSDNYQTVQKPEPVAEVFPLHEQPGPENDAAIGTESHAEPVVTETHENVTLEPVPDLQEDDAKLQVQNGITEGVPAIADRSKEIEVSAALALTDAPSEASLRPAVFNADIDDNYRYDKFGVKNLETLAKDSAYRARQRSAKRQPLHPNLNAPAQEPAKPSRRDPAAIFDGLDLDLGSIDRMPSGIAFQRPTVQKDVQNHDGPELDTTTLEAFSSKTSSSTSREAREAEESARLAGESSENNGSESSRDDDPMLGHSERQPFIPPMKPSGFATAGGRRLPDVPEDKLRASITLLTEGIAESAAPQEQMHAPSDIPKAGAGFATAAGKRLPAMTSEQMERSASLLASPKEKGPAAELPLLGAGFSKATGAKLPEVSADQVAKAKLLFQEVETQAAVDRPPPTSRESDGDNAVPSAHLELKAVEKRPAFGSGFSKATGGKLAEVTAEQMEKVKLLFQDTEADARESIKPRSILETPRSGNAKPEERLLHRNLGASIQPTTPESASLRTVPAKRKPFNTPFKPPSAIKPGIGIEGLLTPVRTPAPSRSRLLHSVVRPRFEGVPPTEVETPSRRAPSKAFTSLFDCKTSIGSRKKLRDLAAGSEALGFDKPESIPQDILLMNPASARVYAFTTSEGSWGPENAFADLIACGADAKLISAAWVGNHYKWIVWKTACTARRFPQARSLWCKQTVLDQLRYRYEQEINRTKRSAIKLIFEQDDTPARPMVLCVSQVTVADDGQVELELTDGWYAVGAQLDPVLSAAVRAGKIFVGLKLLITGAGMSPGEACPPLEAPPHLRLLLRGNSTRRAQWHTRLGFRRLFQPPISIGSIHPEGGPVQAIDVVLLRKFEIQYVEKTERGTVFRNQQEEDKAQREFQDRYDAARLRIKAEMEKNPSKFLDETPPPRALRSGGRVALADIDDGKELFDMLRRHRDGDAFRAQLSEVQRGLLEVAEAEAKERRARILQEELKAQTDVR